MRNGIVHPHRGGRTFGKRPRTPYGRTSENPLSPKFQEYMYGRQPCREVLTMDTSHSPFFAAPEELAGHLESLARG